MKVHPALVLGLALIFTACASSQSPMDGGQDGAVDADDGGQADGVDGDGGDSPDGDDGGGCLDAYPGQVIFTELMFEPQAAPGEAGRFIELYNTGYDFLKLEGWLLSDGVHQVALDLPPDVELAPRSHLLLGFESDPALNGGLEPDLIIAGINLPSAVLIIRAGEVEVDRVVLVGDDWPDGAGASLNLDPDKNDLMQNDLPQNWCPSTESYGAGDLGTPGGANTTCVEAVCGDGQTTYPELCDDGQNGDDGDGCRDNCTFSCSVPSLDCPDSAGDCLSPTCAPNDLGQECQPITDELDVPNDGDPCTFGLCAQDVPYQEEHQAGYPCDNEMGSAGDYCKEGLCVEALCGDHIPGPLEQCDDGNQEDGDGCSAECLLEHCGDSELDGQEQCDDGRNGDDLDGCRDDCKFTCSIPTNDCPTLEGDCHSFRCTTSDLGQICTEIIDMYDPPDDGNPCTDDRCAVDGNFSHQALVDGTACDNLTDQPGDYCAAGVCIDPVCGDGIEGPLEDCDDGNFSVCDGCLPTCQLHSNTCGDGLTCPPEECDDGALEDGDGCDRNCERESGICPLDMVTIPAAPEQGVSQPFCMDVYEASRADATDSSIGSNVNKAVSQDGVLPWYVNPVNTVVFAQFQEACRAAGKRLCAKEEFYSACSLGGQQGYVFGDTFDPEMCNCVDTFCDDYCLQNDIDPCNTAANCGYTFYSFHVMPVGAFPGCTNSYGTYDINGNVWEIVPSTIDARGYEVRGGAFNCAGASARLQCTYNASWNALYAGFRCCRDY